jgi:ribosome maturation factor RimP
MTVSDATRAVVLAAVEPLDVELYDLEHAGGTLRVTVDRPGGIDIDAIAEVTRAVSRALDDADPIPGSYHLEVSSPGLERTLRTPAHWQGAVGERVKVKLRAEVDGVRRVDGTVAAVGDGEVTIDVDGGAPHVVRLDDVERARTVFEWGPAPKPGGPKPGGRAPGGSKGATGAGAKSQSGRTKESQT